MVKRRCVVSFVQRHRTHGQVANQGKALLDTVCSWTQLLLPALRAKPAIQTSPTACGYLLTEGWAKELQQLFPLHYIDCTHRTKHQYGANTSIPSYPVHPPPPSPCLPQVHSNTAPGWQPKLMPAPDYACASKVSPLLSSPAPLPPSTKVTETTSKQPSATMQSPPHPSCPAAYCQHPSHTRTSPPLLHHNTGHITCPKVGSPPPALSRQCPAASEARHRQLFTA